MRLEVAVQNVLGVRGGQRVGDLPAELQRLGHRQLALGALEPAAQRLALQELHDQIHAAIGQLTEIGDLDQTWMVDEVDRSRLVEKAAGELLIAGHRGVQDLDRDSALDGVVKGLEERFVAGICVEKFRSRGALERCWKRRRAGLTRLRSLLASPGPPTAEADAHWGAHALAPQ